MLEIHLLYSSSLAWIVSAEACYPIWSSDGGVLCLRCRSEVLTLLASARGDWGGRRLFRWLFLCFSIAITRLVEPRMEIRPGSDCRNHGEERLLHIVDIPISRAHAPWRSGEIDLGIVAILEAFRQSIGDPAVSGGGLHARTESSVCPAFVIVK